MLSVNKQQPFLKLALVVGATLSSVPLCNAATLYLHPCVHMGNSLQF